jgi:hypothetical protein
VAISRLGFQEFNTATDPGALSCTVPSNTDCIVFAGAYYDSTPGLVSVDLDGSASFTVDVSLTGTGGDQVGIAHLFQAVSAGAHTVNVNWNNALDYVGRLYVVYYSGVDSVGLRDSDGGATNSLTLTTIAGDVVFAVAALDATPTWTNATVFDDTVGGGGIHGTVADMTADGVSETISVTEASTGLGAIVLRPSSGVAAASFVFNYSPMKSMIVR